MIQQELKFDDTTFVGVP